MKMNLLMLKASQQRLNSVLTPSFFPYRQ